MPNDARCNRDGCEMPRFGMRRGEEMDGLDGMVIVSFATIPTSTLEMATWTGTAVQPMEGQQRHYVFVDNSRGSRSSFWRLSDVVSTGRRLTLGVGDRMTR